LPEEQVFQEQYEKQERIQKLESRFRRAGPADALPMFETHINEKGETQSQFEFEAMCERRCAVFGELPPLGRPDEAPKTELNPQPPDEAILRMKDLDADYRAFQQHNQRLGEPS